MCTRYYVLFFPSWKHISSSLINLSSRGEFEVVKELLAAFPDGEWREIDNWDWIWHIWLTILTWPGLTDLIDNSGTAWLMDLTMTVTGLGKSSIEALVDRITRFKGNHGQRLDKWLSNLQTFKKWKRFKTIFQGQEKNEWLMYQNLTFRHWHW